MPDEDKNFGGSLVLDFESSRSVRTIEKASGRQAGSAASGIYQSPLVARPHFQSSTLTESLEQARMHLESLESTQEARVALGYHLGRLLHFFCALQTSRVHP